MEKWALILLLRIEREKLRAIRASRLPPPRKEQFLTETGDMILLLQGELTMGQFASRYPEYASHGPSGE